MEISIKPLTFRNASRLEKEALASVFWILPCSESGLPTESVDPLFDKQLWIQRVLMEWGTCGFTAYVSTGEPGAIPKPAATIFFAPVKYLPGSSSFPTAPVSPDAILVSTVYVSLPYMGLYLEHRLLAHVAREARRRGIKALEAFGRTIDCEESVAAAQDAFVSSGGGRAEEIAWLKDIFWKPTSAWRTAFNDDSVVRPEEAEGFSAAQLPQLPAEVDEEAYHGWRPLERSHTGDALQDALHAAPVLSQEILETEGYRLLKNDHCYPLYRLDIEG